MNDITLRVETSHPTRPQNEHNDCGVCALSVATGRPYIHVHQTTKEAGRKNKRGTPWHNALEGLFKLGFKATLQEMPRNVWQVRDLPRLFPQGRYVFVVYSTYGRTHAVALIDGVVVDNGGLDSVYQRVHSIHKIEPFNAADIL